MNNTNELIFDSFDGGGYEYNAVIDDQSIVSCTESHRYRDENHGDMCGSGYDVIFTFTGIKQGSTKIKIEARSPIIPAEDYLYEVTVDDELNLTINKLNGDS